MDELVGGPVLDDRYARVFVDRARAEGVYLVCPGGLLGGFTKKVLETALEAEMSEHLGCDSNDPVGRNGENRYRTPRPTRQRHRATNPTFENEPDWRRTRTRRTPQLPNHRPMPSDRDHRMASSHRYRHRPLLRGLTKIGKVRAGRIGE